MKSFPEDEKENGDAPADSLQEDQRSACVSPASSQGGVYSVSDFQNFLFNKFYTLYMTSRIEYAL